ncbi:MAG: hypothetical protein Q9P01_12290 [Anaerolineae bacterium]|nr:hypothetical protein [Anaerolineae bacterium]
MSLNGYSYVHGNPVNWTDPSGEICLLALVIGGAIIGFISGGSYDAFANQGFGRQGANDIFNRSLDGSRDLFNREQFLVYGTSGAVIGIITVIHPAGTGATTNVAGSALSGNYQNLSDSEIMLRLTADTAIGGVGGYVWNAGVSRIPLQSGRAFFQRAAIAGTVNTGQGIITRSADNLWFEGDNDIFSVSNIGTDFMWGAGASAGWDWYSSRSTSSGMLRFGARSRNQPIVRMTNRNYFGVHSVNPSYRGLNIGNYQSTPIFSSISFLLSTNFLPPVSSLVRNSNGSSVGNNFPQITLQDTENMGLLPPNTAGFSLIEALEVQNVIVCDAEGPIVYRQQPDMTWIMQIGCETP